MSNFAITFLFKDIFNSYEDFELFIASFTNVDKQDPLNAYLYRYLRNKYANSNINYDTINAFLRHFGITYEDTFSQMKMRTNILNAQYQLTTDELTVISVAITNNALNNNTLTTDPLNTVIEYISNQVSNQAKENKLIAYIKALDNVSNKYLVEYLESYKVHFMRILINQQFIYEV